MVGSSDNLYVWFDNRCANEVCEDDFMKAKKCLDEWNHFEAYKTSNLKLSRAENERGRGVSFELSKCNSFLKVRTDFFGDWEEAPIFASTFFCDRAVRKCPDIFKSRNYLSKVLSWIVWTVCHLCDNCFGSLRQLQNTYQASVGRPQTSNILEDFYCILHANTKTFLKVYWTLIHPDIIFSQFSVRIKMHQALFSFSFLNMKYIGLLFNVQCTDCPVTWPICLWVRRDLIDLWNRCTITSDSIRHFDDVTHLKIAFTKRSIL